jgi:hypothetical protein
MTCLCRHGEEAGYSSNPFASSALEGGGWSASRPGHFTHCTGRWVVLGAGMEGKKNLPLTGVPSPDRPARSKSLYRLSKAGNNMGTHTISNVSFSMGQNWFKCCLGCKTTHFILGSGIWRRVVWHKFADVAEERSVAMRCWTFLRNDGIFLSDHVPQYYASSSLPWETQIKHNSVIIYVS